MNGGAPLTGWELHARRSLVPAAWFCYIGRSVTLAWTAHPARRRPRDLALVAAVLFLTAGAVLVAFESLFMTGLAVVILLLSITSFLFPTHYRLSEEGVEERRLGVRRARRWADLRRVEIGPGPSSDAGWRGPGPSARKWGSPMGHEDRQADALESALSDEDRAFLDKVADGLARRRLTTVALFFLESMKPLGFLGSQAMLFFRPIVSVVFSSPDSYDRLTKILERRGSIELLLRRLEARS